MIQSRAARHNKLAVLSRKTNHLPALRLTFALLFAVSLAGCAIFGSEQDVDLFITDLEWVATEEVAIEFVSLRIENRGFDDAVNAQYRIWITPSGEEPEPVGGVQELEETFTLYRGVVTVPARSSETLEIALEDLISFATFAELDYPAGSYQISAEVDYTNRIAESNEDNNRLGGAQVLEVLTRGGVSVAPPGVIRVLIDGFEAPVNGIGEPTRVLDVDNPLRVWVIPAGDLFEPQPYDYATERVVTALGVYDFPEGDLTKTSATGEYVVALAHDDGSFGDLIAYFSIADIALATWYSERGRQPENLLMAGVNNSREYVTEVRPGQSAAIRYNLQNLAFEPSVPLALGISPGSTPDAPEVDITAANAAAEAPGLPLLQPDTGYGGATTESGTPRAYRLSTPPGAEVVLVVDDGFSGTGQYSYDTVGDIWRKADPAWITVFASKDFDDIPPATPFSFIAGTGPSILELEPIGPDSNILVNGDPLALPEYAGTAGTYGIAFSVQGMSLQEQAYGSVAVTGSGTAGDPYLGPEELDLALATNSDPLHFRSEAPDPGSLFVRLWILDQTVAAGASDVAVRAQWQYTDDGGLSWSPLSDVGGAPDDADGDGIVLGTAVQPVVAALPPGTDGFRLIFDERSSGSLPMGDQVIIGYDFYK